MGDAGAMQRRQPARQIDRQHRQRLRRELPLGGQLGLQRAPLDQLHRQRHAIADLDEIVNAHHARVRHLARGAQLAAKTRHRLTRRRAQHLDGHVLGRHPIVRAIDDSKGAAPELALDLVPIT